MEVSGRQMDTRGWGSIGRVRLETQIWESSLTLNEMP